MTTTLLHNLHAMLPSTLPSTPTSGTLSPPLLTPPTPSHHPGKIFVGGLSWETDEISLKQYFSQFGTVMESVIMRDRHTGHPRGFGFVTFRDEMVARNVAKERHDVDGRTVEAKIAVPRSEIKSTSTMSTTSGNNLITGKGTVERKVFVGGLPACCGEEELEEYFGRFGKVVDRQILYDRVTGNSRGFGFVVFAEDETVEEVVKVGRHEILGKFVEVKKAEPRQIIRKSTTAANAAPIGMQAGLVAPGFVVGPHGFLPPGHILVPVNIAGSMGLSVSPGMANPFAAPVPQFASPNSSSSSLQSVSPWDQGMQSSLPSKNVWSTGYLAPNGEPDDLADVLDKVMNTKGNMKPIGTIDARDEEVSHPEDDGAYRLFA